MKVIKAATMRGGLDKPTNQQLQARIAELEQQHAELLAECIKARNAIGDDPTIDSDHNDSAAILDKAIAKAQ